MIRMGTSGFSYDDWIGKIYPRELPKWQWLSYYARSFNTVELNVTYYRLPTPKLIKGWIERTPDDFLFTVKAHQSLTHARKDPDFEGFYRSVEGLLDGDRLACVLAQFPHSFHPSKRNWDYLRLLREGMRDLPVVVEFRGRDWVVDGTFALLEELNLGFCCVDEPDLAGLMPKITKVTGPIAYVRFHGRNSEKWWKHEKAWERYDYTYSEEELSEWVPKILDLDEKAILTLVYANNHYRGQSVDTLTKLQHLMS